MADPEFCGCIGPMYGEPYCPCGMRRLGLPPSAERLKAMEEANKRLQELLGPGGKYHRAPAQESGDDISPPP